MTQKLPKISVIIPVYNVENTLERCLSSVQAQTYDNLEIILVDDGSTDGSGELCNQLGKQDSRIRVIHQSNQGLSAARNAGLKLTSGKYVTFVDSDDTIESSLIQDLYKLIQKHHVKLVIASFSEVFPDGHKKNFAASINSATPTTFDTTTCLIEMLGEHGFTLMACGKLYARELFDHVEFPVGKLYEDVGTTYRVILQCPEIAFLPEPLYNYYQNSASIVHQSFSTQKLDLITLTDQMCDKISQSKLQQTPDLEFALARRRMQARFSVLRQIVVLPSKDQQKFLKTRNEVIVYLRAHRDDILKNPLASHRDRFAMLTLLMGLPVFRLAWKIYQKLR